MVQFQNKMRHQELQEKLNRRAKRSKTAVLQYTLISDDDTHQIVLNY